MSSMIPPKIRKWFLEELELLFAKGATKADLAEPAFADLLAKRVIAKHGQEIDQDEELFYQFLLAICQHGSVATLRELADLSRKIGAQDLAYDLEQLADERD
jgi:hypothetical protein